MELQPLQGARWRRGAVMTFAGAITLIGSKLLAFVPLRLIAAVSGPLATLGWWLAKSRRRVALTNLRLCFPENPTPNARPSRAGTSVPTCRRRWSMVFCGTPAVSASGNM